jgi:glycosyltransferase involved in cell wall biosynthesis
LKVSVIITLKNEESSIKTFLDSILDQTRKPDEIVMVDGGSNDGTVKIINQYIQKGAPINLIIKQGANISMGRNIAIKNSKFDIVASTDLGCRVDKDWLKKLIEKFNDEIDVVSGVTIPEPRNDVEKCMAELTCYKIEEINEETFLPSSRSIAFRKSAWEKGGGYPEWLDIAEDTYFDLSMKKAGCNFKVAKDAIVYWFMRDNYRKLFKQYYKYSSWNRKAGLATPKSAMILLIKTFWPLGILFLGLIPIIFFNAPIYLPILIILVILFFLINNLKDGMKCYRLNNSIIFFFRGIFIRLVLNIARTMGLVFNRKISPIQNSK